MARRTSRVFFAVLCLALTVFLAAFFYRLTHWKIAIGAKNDLDVPLRVEIDICGVHKTMTFAAKEFLINDWLSIKQDDDYSVSGTLRVFDDAKGRLLYETELKRFESILSNNNDEFPLRLDFRIFLNAEGKCDVEFDYF